MTITYLSKLTKSYLALTQEEIELCQSSPLQFYISQKDATNEVKGNQLREKAKEMMAGINFRMPQHFKKFFELFVAPEL